MKRPRSPSWCRGPWSLRSLEAPVRRLDAPSEPQGPCLPAGPPELLLGLVREGAAVHAAILTHYGRLMQTFIRPGRPASDIVRCTGARPRPVGQCELTPPSPLEEREVDRGDPLEHGAAYSRPLAPRPRPDRGSSPSAGRRSRRLDLEAQSRHRRTASTKPAKPSPRRGRR